MIGIRSKDLHRNKNEDGADRGSFPVPVTWAVERGMAGRARMDFVLGHLDLGLNDADISMKILFLFIEKNSHERKVRGQETFFER